MDEETDQSNPMKIISTPALAGQTSAGESLHLDLATASDLLQKRGYELVCRFEHVHAAAYTQEWHVCLLAELASMTTACFLARLDESLEQSVQGVMARFSQA